MGGVTIPEDRLKKLVSEMRDAAETALDMWSDPEIRATQIVEALDAAAGIVDLIPAEAA